MSWSTLLPILVILRVFVSDLWAIGRCARRPLVAIDRSAIAVNWCCLHGRNWQITAIRRQNSRFRQRFSKIGLSYNCGPSLEYCVWVWCTLIRKWPRNTPNNNNRRYAVSSDWKICRSMCQHWAWWPWKWYARLVASKVRNLHSELLHARPSGSRIIRYVRDGRTDKSNAYCPLPYGRGHNKCLMFLLFIICLLRPMTYTNNNSYSD